MKVRVLGAHNLEVEHARHTCFLLDGKVAIDAGSLMTSLGPDELGNIQAILLTHRHFDHVRDLPSLGLATLDNGGTVSVYSLPETLDSVSSRLMDGVLYPNLSKDLTGKGPKYEFKPVTPGESLTIEGYAVRPIRVPHAAPTVGYIFHEPEGSSFAYCGDTGGGLLPFFQDPFKPGTLFIEITFPGRMEERAKLTGHLTPELLQREITEAISLNQPLPRIMIVHRSPRYEEEITQELAGVASKLGVELTLAREGMTVDV